ncbi:hypothetical protein OH491_03970 [Termitidicoccus mucosus]|uniref:hypothetical protein n=1 Tax=Termitidicoccus mucosus TaxID=1184151 RepID=UPI003183A2A3
MEIVFIEKKLEPRDGDNGDDFPAELHLERADAFQIGQLFIGERQHVVALLEIIYLVGFQKRNTRRIEFLRDGVYF